jgi:4-hydroxythreonine-4-phosphate dehydrogenase
MGEPAGIGPEIALTAFDQLGGHIGGHALKLVGDPGVFRSCGPVPSDALIATGHEASRVPGKPQLRNAAAVCEAIEISVAAAKTGAAAAIVTAPINKAALAEADFRFPGHTEFLAHLTGIARPVMMLCGAGLRVVPLTIHIPVAEIVGAISTDAIVETGKIILEALTRDFAVAGPRLAVSGLNPHAGEEGMLGDEERVLIAPAIARLKSAGARVVGPLPADTMFHEEARAQYDAALCMYHDQALIPIKALAFWEGVNVTLGLPIVRTSPDHGTALDVAGKGKADPRSMVAAIRLAAQIADARGR